MLQTSFASAVSIEGADRVALLGGKGAALVDMTALGLAVPPGFTLTTTACKRALETGWDDELAAELSAGLAGLEATGGRRLGDPSAPLLVSVRSGAPVSMPGMMDTVLNVGMTDSVAEGLGVLAADNRFGWDSARRFVQSYVTVVGGASPDMVRACSDRALGTDEGRSLSAEQLRSAVASLRAELDDAGFVVPVDPFEQLAQAVQAVFASWLGDRACAYRRIEGIDESLGTAATVQMMAFGNRGQRSGTGVVFSRNPSTGEPGLFGDFMVNAQGEDVVAGTHKTLPIAAMADTFPEIAAELRNTAALLERHIGDLADIEFTVEQDQLYLLQVRRGKCTPQAALRIAVDMADDPEFPLTRSDAVDRVGPILADPPTVPGAAPTGEPSATPPEVLAAGLAASPGRQSGLITTSVEDAILRSERGEPVVLVRRETSPADVVGMAAAVAIVTALGGMVSHAAVVARDWATPAVVGAAAIEVLPDGIRIGDRMIPAGTEVTVDGTTGEVLLGRHGADTTVVPEVAILRGWQQAHSAGVSGDPGAGGGESREPLTRSVVARVLSIKGMADPAALSAATGATEEEAAAVLSELIAAGDVESMPMDRVRPTDSLRQFAAEEAAAASARLRPVIEPLLEDFHAMNEAFKQVVTDWQMKTVGGQMVPNDHTDVAYDQAVLARLRDEVHPRIDALVSAVTSAEPRFGRYRERLSLALAAIDQGSHEMIAHPFKDSYHTVWFELHEELIRLSGRNRADEAAAGRG